MLLLLQKQALKTTCGHKPSKKRSRAAAKGVAFKSHPQNQTKEINHLADTSVRSTDQTNQLAASRANNDQDVKRQEQDHQFIGGKSRSIKLIARISRNNKQRKETVPSNTSPLADQISQTTESSVIDRINSKKSQENAGRA
ncbi:hypothetical protein PCANC_14761 [Puccinia coronata f. sp. avenae]|uniref:Uncharacterized protein n=1 Tax=Puccinia coronata f. sp. avenae TaxID=200324 RepID=A0A2N5SIM0_9BASI|nr:hypothetical protein PCANC_14761 [Puccinia coronata f. sp. avenae]